ncbi:hypothetical protein E4T56_gene12631 [Termitomyces sp. T112]|nr:hypothetical protein C0989_006412 [Termitomyces sp. Mn162]KAG5724827.1 hypothetical protein E4T56_gene12631 [Termitomyces sp. T112]KNZ76934.1 hypothetical protein J132_10881 [Termitomyces sp. J132]
MSCGQANEGRPIVFHTLPATPRAEGADKSSDKTQGGTSVNQNTSKLSKATTSVPRLLSVVEIVKREFIKSLVAKRSPRLAGLHQYNEIGCLEDFETNVEKPEEDRAAEIRRALSGGNHVKVKLTPYMKITLSLNALPELAERGATYQSPTIRKLSKSAKMRMKKRERAPKHQPPETTGSTSEAAMED